MTARLHVLLALIALFPCMGASYPTPNFIVHAPNQEIAQRIGQYAEHYRKEKAIQWLGREMPQWPQPCPLYVKVTMDGPSGATSFNFDTSGRGGVVSQRMEIQGPLDRLIASVLPHEITHTVYAYHFRRPVPRWADEGGSVLSEDDIERIRHDKLVRGILNSGQQIPMRTLFGLKEYPRQVMCLYAQGYSMSNYLVERSNKQTFLNFVADGMQSGWDHAAWTYYQHRSVEELEEAWLQRLRETKGQPHLQLAQGKQRAPGNQVASTPLNNSGTVVRLTVPPTFQQTPIIRGQSPSDNEVGQRMGSRPMQTAGGYNPNPAVQPSSRPGYLPEYAPPANPGWRPQGQAQNYQPQVQPRQDYQPVPIRLGAPQYGQMPPGPIPSTPGNLSPVGYPQ